MKKTIIIFIATILVCSNITVNALNSLSEANNSTKNSLDNEQYAIIMVGRYFPKIDFNQTHWGPEGNWTNLEEIQKFYTWYLKDASRMYTMLRDKYGYNEENIYLLVKQLPDFINVSYNQTDAEGKIIKKTFFKIPTEFNPKWIDKEYSPDESGFKKLLNTFKPNGKNSLTSEDSLFVCFIDHGATEKHEDGTNSTYFGCPLKNVKECINYFTYIFNLLNTSKIKIGDGKILIECVQDLIELLGFHIEPEKLYDYELGNTVKDIDSKIIFALQPCNSGGFIEELSGSNRIICTASRTNEFADRWIGPFREALEGSRNSDYNNDGKISILEAYRYAAEIVDKEEEPNHPQDALIDDNGDGIGHHYNESGYNASNSQSDGYLANTTYLGDAEDDISLNADADGPYKGAIGDEIELIGSASGGIPPYKYSWDVNEDDDFKDATGARPHVTFDKKGQNKIKLKVTDNVGNTAYDDSEIDIVKVKAIHSIYQNFVGKNSLRFYFLITLLNMFF